MLKHMQHENVRINTLALHHDFCLIFLHLSSILVVIVYLYFHSFSNLLFIPMKWQFFWVFQWQVFCKTWMYCTLGQPKIFGWKWTISTRGLGQNQSAYQFFPIWKFLTTSFPWLMTTKFISQLQQRTYGDIINWWPNAINWYDLISPACRVWSLSIHDPNTWAGLLYFYLQPQSKS